MSKSVHELLFLVISSLEYEMSKHCAGVTLIRCYFKLNFRNGFFEYYYLKCKTHYHLEPIEHLIPSPYLRQDHK